MPLSARFAVALAVFAAGPAWACPGPDAAATPCPGELTPHNVLTGASPSTRAGGLVIKGDGLTHRGGNGLVRLRPGPRGHGQGEAAQLVIGRGRDPLLVLAAAPTWVHAVSLGKLIMSETPP